MKNQGETKDEWQQRVGVDGERSVLQKQPALFCLELLLNKYMESERAPSLLCNKLRGDLSASINRFKIVNFRAISTDRRKRVLYIYKVQFSRDASDLLDTRNTTRAKLAHYASKDLEFFPILHLTYIITSLCIVSHQLNLYFKSVPAYTYTYTTCTCSLND